ncbi:MAG TPA: hypothetical protein VF170_01965 [Planctomycetaceae bacterium]
MATSDPVDPAAVFISGLAWERSSRLLAHRAGELMAEDVSAPDRPWIAKWSLHLQVAVMDTFAVEMYLKCIHYLDNGHAPHHHRLHGLFLELSPARRQNLIDEYHRCGLGSPPHPQIIAHHPTPLPHGLEGWLIGANIIFERFRYWYEPAKPGSSPTARWPDPAVPVAFRRTITTMRPDWLPMTAGFDT